MADKIKDHSLQAGYCVEWSVAERTLPGQGLSGDGHVVIPRRDGMLAAVVDGLGHGSEAAAAAQAAIAVLKENPEKSVISLVEDCHRALHKSRGAVMTVVVFNMDENTLTALGIGNVETVLLRADPVMHPPCESVLLRGGLVGYQLPALHASVFPIQVNDLVVFATDGIRDNFYEQLNAADPVKPMAERILAQKFRGTDDGLVLAIRYMGKPYG
jgi:serine/threonine protein phosphatase PrpC